jgi:hypothetical protein
MRVAELLETAQFLVDTNGNRKAVVLDYARWEAMLTILEDMEDAQEIRGLREAGEEALPWPHAKEALHRANLDV